MRKSSPSKFDSMLADIAVQVAAREERERVGRSPKLWFLAILLWLAVFFILATSLWSAP